MTKVKLKQPPRGGQVAPLAHEQLGTPGDHRTNQLPQNPQPAWQGEKEMVVVRGREGMPW